MILTCPDCATRYFVDEQRLGPQGRTVRCAGCGSSWRAQAETEPLELVPVTAPAEPAPPRPGDELPKTFRAKVQAKQRTRKAVAAGVVWGALAAGVALLLVLAAVFRVQVVRLWPRTAGAYAAVGLPVNPLGLTPEGVQAATGLLNGHAALTVTGAERNIDPSPRPPAPLQVSLYDRAGHRLAQKIVRLPDLPIRPGETRPFKVSFIDPPLAGNQIGVEFMIEPRTAHHSRSQSRGDARLAGAAPQLRPRGLEAPQVPAATAAPAQGLPAGSPYALPVAAEAQLQQGHAAAPTFHLTPHG